MDTSDLVKVKSIYNSLEPKTEFIVTVKNYFVKDCSDFEIDVYTDRHDSSKTTVVAKKNDTAFSGSCVDPVCQNYFIIANRKKKRARLLPINICDLSEVYARNSSPTILPDLDINSGRALLSEKFGSKRSKRRTDLIKRMQVNPDACEEQLKSIIGETHIDISYFEDLDDGTESLERLIPPCNRFASVPQGVYNLNDLINENERLSLKEAAEFLIENPPSEDDTVNSLFLVKHYRLISKSIDVDKIIILLYADSLLKLLKMHPKELKQRDGWNKVSPYSKFIISKLKREFTESRIVTVFMKHKVVCHILIAVLLVSNFTIHLDLISPFFPGIDSKKLLQLCRLVGVSTQSKSSNDVLILKLPLPPMPTARSPKKKRR